MTSKEKIVAKLGSGFCTKRRIADVLGYKDARSVERFISGLERFAGSRYWSEDVADRIMGELER